MAWVKIDIDEMSRIGRQLEGAALDLENTAARIGSTACCGGLGRHAAPLQAEAGVVSTNLRAVARKYREFALEAVLRALVVALQEHIARNPTAVAIGAGATVGAVDNVWRPVPPALHREWVRKGWLPASSLNPPSSDQALAQKNMEQMNNNVMNNNAMKRLWGLQAVTKPIGFSVTRADAMNYQSNVSSSGYRGNSYNSSKFR